ncbi:MAG: xanthine dehydrogenase family protein subunit M [Bryobacterales bacterium]
MQAFQYASPTTVQEALDHLSSTWGEVDVLAGGTDLLSLMKERIHTPNKVVGLRGIKELRGISKSGNNLRIGATVTVQELADNSQIQKQYPALAQAAAGIHSPQMRSMGTVAGDLLQRPRCWYFRRGMGLLAKSDGKSLIPTGENRYHAILGNKGPAYFVNASSLAPALVALGAKVKVVSKSGSREVEIEKLYRAPAGDSERELDLKPDELVTEILIPASGARSATYEVRERQLLDWPLTTASVVLEMSGNTVKSARVVMGHVAPMPWRSSQAEQALAGKTVSEDVAMAAGKAAVAAATPLSQNKYKVQLASVAVKRAVLAAAGRA